MVREVTLWQNFVNGKEKRSWLSSTQTNRREEDVAAEKFRLSVCHLALLCTSAEGDREPPRSVNTSGSQQRGCYGEQQGGGAHSGSDERWRGDSGQVVCRMWRSNRRPLPALLNGAVLAYAMPQVLLLPR